MSVIEIAGGPFPRPFEEAAEIRFDPSGSATVLLGSHSHGQGHETTFRQIAHHALGLPPERVTISYGDTDKVFHGRGTFGSRSMATGGAAFMRAAEKVIERGKLVAAHLLEASAADIEFADGRFTVAGTDRSIDLIEVAKASFVVARMPRELPLGLDGNAIVTPDGATFPNGFHVCEVEIDPDTGVPIIKRYSVVDDVGRMVNPLLLKGQVHGGIAQGVGQALGENLVYDRDGGQLIAGSFMDYMMPRADDLPAARGRQPRRADPDEPARRERRGRGRHRRRAAGGHECGQRRARPARHPPFRDAGDPGARVARDPVGERRAAGLIDHGEEHSAHARMRRL